LICFFLKKIATNFYFFFYFFSILSRNRYSKREEAQEAIASLNNVIPQGGNQPLIVRIAEEHGRAKAALFLPQYNQFVQNRGRMRVRNQPY
jgi:protein sex-lethal